MKLTPADLRDLTWESLQPFLTGARLAVLEAWRTHGPCTTRELSQRSGIDLLTLRPRTTELVALGLVMLHDSEGTEGTYRGIPAGHARGRFERIIAGHRTPQQTHFNL